MVTNRKMDAAVVIAISCMGYIIDYRAQECLLNHFEPYCICSMVPSSIAVCAINGSTDMINSTITEGDGDTGAKNANTVWCEKRPRAEHDWIGIGT